MMLRDCESLVMIGDRVVAGNRLNNESRCSDEPAWHGGSMWIDLEGDGWGHSDDGSSNGDGRSRNNEWDGICYRESLE
jgi:hypothetical protein